MKFYLSSFTLGDKSNDLIRLMPENKKIAYIPNACDYTNVDLNSIPFETLRDGEVIVIE